jgi:UDP-glucose 4-epimerase
MKRVVVTGGAGFIGSHLVKKLLDSGVSVTVLDNLSTGRVSNIETVREHVEMVDADVRSLDSLTRPLHGADVVFHLAALPSVPRSLRDPVTTHEVNATGTVNVLVKSREASVSRVIVASSSSIYGNPETLPVMEDLPMSPQSPYAASKASAEIYASAFWKVYGLETVRLRFFNVFGPRQDPNSLYSAVIPLFMQAVMERRPCRVYGDGSQSRDFTYVDNVVHACMLAAQSEGCAGEAINCAAGERRSLLDLVAAIERVTGSPLPRQHDQARHGEVLHSMADISKASRLMGYSPLVDFEEGLRRVWEWMQGQGQERT